MNFRSAFICLSLLGCVFPSHADVECRVYCSGSAPCVAGHQDTKALPGNGVRIANCSDRSLKSTAAATVWYSRKSLSVVNPIPADTAIATVVADGDASCFWPFCFRSKSVRVAGGTYMGQGDTAEVSDAVIAAGLPFEELALADEGLAIHVDSAGGVLDLKEATGPSVGSFSATGGRLVVPANRLKTDVIYTYQWRPSGGAPLSGSFRIAPPGKVKRARDYAASLNGPTPTLQKIDLANAYMATGLRWNALVLISELERGQ